MVSSLNSSSELMLDSLYIANIGTKVQQIKEEIEVDSPDRVSESKRRWKRLANVFKSIKLLQNQEVTPIHSRK